MFSQASADTAQLRTAVGPATPEGDARRERSGAEPRAREQRNGPPIIGQSAPMQAVRRLIEMAAPTPAPVLITGETGTGKELVAQTLHALSSRARGPFVAINSSPIPETLLEGEMFGHENGAFTGAFERRAGSFELAHGVFPAGVVFKGCGWQLAEVSAAMIESALRELTESGLVQTYCANGNRYVCFPSWQDDQRIDRPRHSTPPDPEFQSDNGNNYSDSNDSTNPREDSRNFASMLLSWAGAVGT